ncbi:FG-GAP-like repeat-containing protein [Hymenobacter sp. ASUV-10]|uniref:FG-GAP-like repeat-containing protein n=1 Tax=Hymenobacter aranciens TaxID=3063996 RepID=A0ABT9BMQ2_9BACT|nr:FG-GAP-like repeat-containing protein [Hymenobacter sp. ASUV-10]MDO7877798.1 FG-GAP-like repeat-containing protein [Hymenobacter sp. ASUV-10]
MFFPAIACFCFLRRHLAALLLLALLPAGRLAQAQAPVITSLTPARNALNVPRPANVVLRFSDQMQPSAATRGAVRVHSMQRGGMLRDGQQATTTLNNYTYTLTLDPATDFKSGETLMVTTTTAAVTASAGYALARPRVQQFTTAVSSEGGGSFAGGSDVGVGDYAGSVAVGDVDGDGDLDLLTVNTNTNTNNGGTVSVRLNDGNGGLSGGSDPGVGNSPQGIALGDVDGDGDLDFVTASPILNTVSVRLNNGSGGFGGGSEVGVGAGARKVALGDFDGDGDLDLVAATQRANTVSVRFNNGNGTFGGGAEVRVDARTDVNSYNVTVGDVDNDGDLDILTANDNWIQVGILLNGGDNSGSNTGVFTRQASLNVTVAPRNLALGDLDGDGDLDLVSSGIGGNSDQYVCLNNGSGGFASSFIVRMSAQNVALSDMDGDGDLDLVGSQSGQQVNVWFNDGSAGFSAGTATPVPDVRYVATGDMNDDGSLDIITASINGGAGTARVRLNQPGPTISGFVPASAPVGTRVTATGTRLTGATKLTLNGTPVYGFTVGGGGTSLTFVVPGGATTGPVVVTAPAGIGTSSTPFTVVPEMTISFQNPARNAKAAPRPDNVTRTFSQALENTAATRGALVVHSRQRGGMLREGQQATVTVSGNTLTLDPASDFQPGETLLVTTTTAATGTNGSKLLRGDVQQFTTGVSSAGGGRFAGGSDFGVGNSATSVVVGDLNRDDILDLLVARADGTVDMRFGAGYGIFPGNYSLTGVGPGPQVLALGDLNGDGNLDLVAAATTSNIVSVRLNNGAGPYALSRTVTVGSNPHGVALGDVDGDGDLDLLTANYFSSSVSVRLNGGDATGSNTGDFSGGSEVTVSSYPQCVAVGDLDGDGDLDLATGNNSNSTYGIVNIRFNDGFGLFDTFNGSNDYTVGVNPVAIVLGDIDLNRSLDILTADSGGGTVSILVNNGGGYISSNSRVTGIGSNPVGLALGDVNGDGYLDLLTANNNGSGTVSVRLNNNGLAGFTTGTDPAVGANPQSIALADLDDDGDLDFVTANGGNSASVRLNQPKPTISGFTPGTGSAGMTVTVTGTNLGGVTAVTLNGTAAPLTGTTGTSLTFTVPAGATTGPISVTAPGGTATTSLSFEVVPAPVISGFTPASGPVGTQVTVNGSGLIRASSVTVNGVPVTSFTGGAGGTSLSFTVPAGISSGPIAITTAGGTATSSTSFTFINIASYSPAVVSSGTTITLTGSGLGGATGLTLNGAPITGYTVGGGGTTITFVVPAGATSGSIVVNTPGGPATSPGTLSVDNVPPSATLSTTAGSPTGASPIPFSISFGESVTGFADSDIVVSNGSVTSGSVSGSGGSYTFTVTPASYRTVVRVSVRAGAVQDGAGNPSPASNTISVAYDGPPPVADLLNAGAQLAVQAGAILVVGTGGLGNQDGTLTNAGTLRVAGALTNPAAGTLDLGAGTLEARGDLLNAGTLRPGSSAVTFSGAADQLLTPGGATLYQVLVSKATAGANTLRLGGDLTVSNNLTLTDGLVNTHDGTTLSTLRLPATATLSGEASGRYVQGSLAVTRPVGSGAAVNFGHGATLDPGTNSLGAVTITRTAGLLTNDVSRGVSLGASANQGIDRIYTVSADTPPSAAVQLTLAWLTDNDNGLSDFSQARAWQQTAAGQPWVARSLPTNANARSLTFSASTLGRFTVSNTANPLPVTLLDFTAQAEGPAAARLRWATAQELNNAGFVVERSPDGRTFAAIGTVAGAGTSTTRHDYTLLDDQLPGGATLLYYRLRQTDLNGDFAYSPVRPVAFAAAAPGFGVYPTRLAGGQDATYLYSGPAGAGQLEVLNVLGQVLRTAALDGRASGPVPLAGLPTGTYLLRYTGPAGRFVTRCVVE